MSSFVLSTYTEAARIACLTAIASKLVGVNVCGQAVCVIEVNDILQYVVGVYHVISALSINKYSILTSMDIIHIYG